MRKSLFVLSVLTLPLFASDNNQPNPPPVSQAQLFPTLQMQPAFSFKEINKDLSVGLEKINYKATSGYLPVLNEKHEQVAQIFFTAYTKLDAPENRPITFCFNGGPGSSSIWLHMGLLGPYKIKTTDAGLPSLPFGYETNPESMLDVTDLVFIDPVSTGYSKTINGQDPKQFHSWREDIKSVASFIRLYITHFNRWLSPKFLAGESYGTTRATGLAKALLDDHDIALNGIMLISSVLDFQVLDFKLTNDLYQMYYLPTYTAVAWYHKKLSPELQELSLAEAIKRSVSYATQKLPSELVKGQAISPDQMAALANDLSQLTGLSQEYLLRCHCRIDAQSYMKELLRGDARAIGRFDGRLKGIESNQNAETPERDPTYDLTFPAFTASYNAYVRSELKWDTDQEYRVLENVFPWDFQAKNEYLNVVESIREVLDRNSFTHVFVANGLYDLAIPFFSTYTSFRHLFLDPSLTANITFKDYEGGHMMYLVPPILKDMKKDMKEFYEKALEPPKK